MSVSEAVPRLGEVDSIYNGLTAPEVIATMQMVAPPGSDVLDEETVGRLTRLTGRLIELEGDGAIAEYERYTGTAERRLELPDGLLREQLSGKTVLVTGGTGLIGSALLQELTRYMPRRLVSVSLSEPLPYPRVDSAEYFDCDLRDRTGLGAIMEAVKPDIVYHVAADKYNHEAERRARHTLTTNIIGTKHVIEAAEDAGVKQLVYASTGKATRPFSPDIYASSKKTGEWLVAQAAVRGQLFCSGARFTHVVNNSNVQRKIHERIDSDSPVSLQDPDVWFYVQSAGESAQLLLNAGLGAEPGVLNIQAIRDLGAPINLAKFGLGAIAKRGARVPIYFRGTVEGYEEQAWPFLYGPANGDFSPLLNVIETHDAKPSPTCTQIDTFPLEVDRTTEVMDHFNDLLEACATEEPVDLRSVNQALSWKLLAARLSAVPHTALRGLGRRIERMPVEHFNDEHLVTNRYVLDAIDRKEE